MRPHAELIEKYLEEGRWYYRISPDGEWLVLTNPSFNSSTEYKLEPRYCEKRTAMVRDWLSGTEYQILRWNNWEPASCEDLLQVGLDFLRKKPNIVKMRIRNALMASSLKEGTPFFMTALTDEHAMRIEGLKQFMRWVGPWQETEVEI